MPLLLFCAKPFWQVEERHEKEQAYHQGMLMSISWIGQSHRWRAFCLLCRCRFNMAIAGSQKVHPNATRGSKLRVRVRLNLNSASC